jgi:hypothetical protein
MVGDDEVDGLAAVPVEGVGQNDLGRVHVDPDDELLNLGRRVAGEEARVGVGIEQPVRLPGVAFVVLELRGAGPLLVEDPPDRFRAARVVGDADRNGLL